MLKHDITNKGELSLLVMEFIRLESEDEEPFRDEPKYPSYKINAILPP